MKKTVLLLLSAAGMAMGTTDITNQLIWNADRSQATLPNLDNKEITIVATLAWDKLPNMSYQENVQFDFFTIRQTESYKRLGAGINYKYKGELSIIYTKSEEDKSIYVSDKGAFVSITQDNVESAAFVFTSQPNGSNTLTKSYLYLWETGKSEPTPFSVELNRQITLSFDSLHINTELVQDIQVFQGIDNDPQTLATNLKNASIPEPATATLSLLALAGLAARRRRR